MPTTIAVFGASGSAQGDEHYVQGIRCGALLAEAGFAVATGGYGGTMEAVSLGARRAGGHVIGVTAPDVFLSRSEANKHLTEETQAGSLVERIGILTEKTDGSIALWGSLGTAAELLIAWNLSYVARFSGDERKPIIAVGEPWLSLIPHLEATLDTDSGLVEVVADAEAAVLQMVRTLG